MNCCKFTQESNMSCVGLMKIRDGSNDCYFITKQKTRQLRGSHSVFFKVNIHTVPHKLQEATDGGHSDG